MPASTRSARNPKTGRAQSVRSHNGAKTQSRAVRSGSIRARSASADALTLLRADHERVDEMFKQFARMKTDGEEKHALAHMICKELKIHTTIEEEIFYPAVREATGDHALMDEADVEHESARALIAQVESAVPGDDHYDARVAVLGEYIRHHVKEEQGQVFPKVRRAKIDLKALGAEMAARKEELQGNGRQHRDLLTHVLGLPAF